jgi:hypothetical protein
MINCVFWDLDETLIHSMDVPNGDEYDFTIETDGGGWVISETYYVKVRRDSRDVIAHSRELVGPENVFILTAATYNYALDICNKANFGFKEDQIISREHIRHFVKPQESKYRNKDNVLIDNLPVYDNLDKLNVIGIRKDRYLKIDDYYGVDFSNELFKEDCKEFLNSLHREL